MWWENIMSGVVQVGIGHPMETVKVRMQSSGLGAPKVVRDTWSTRGVQGFYAGALIPFILAPIYNGILFRSYQSLRKDQWTPFWAGATIGTGMGVLLQPFEVIKSRRQSGFTPCQIFTNMSAGIQWTIARESLATGVYFGVFEALQEQNSDMLPLNGGIAGCASLLASHPVDTIKTKYQVGGINKNIFRGMNVALVRSMIVNSLLFSIYEGDR